MKYFQSTVETLRHFRRTQYSIFYKNVNSINLIYRSFLAVNTIKPIFIVKKRNCPAYLIIEAYYKKQAGGYKKVRSCFIFVITLT